MPMLFWQWRTQPSMYWLFHISCSLAFARAAALVAGTIKRYGTGHAQDGTSRMLCPMAMTISGREAAGFVVTVMVARRRQRSCSGILPQAPVERTRWARHCRQAACCFTRSKLQRNHACTEGTFVLVSSGAVETTMRPILRSANRNGRVAERFSSGRHGDGQA